MQLTGFEDLVRAAGPQVATLLALIAANTLLGIAVSIKQRKFEWSQVANFYVDDVIPKLLGYLAIRLLKGWIIPAQFFIFFTKMLQTSHNNKIRLAIVVS